MARIKSKKYIGVYLNHLKDNDIVFYITYKDLTNKLKWLKVGNKSGGINEKFCKAKRDEILNTIRLGEDPTINKKKKEIITLDEVFEKYKRDKIDHGAVFTSTEKNYNAHLKKRYGKRDIEYITTDEALKLKTDLKDLGKSDKTISVQIGLLKTLFNFAIEEKIFNKPNPLQHKKFKEKKIDNTRDRYLTTDEVKELYSAIEFDTALSLFVKLSLTTGGRLETILNIQKKDLNLDSHTVTLKDLKNNSTYKGFLDDDIVIYLKKYIQNLTANSYLVGGQNTKYATRTLQRKLLRIIDDLFNQGLDSKDSKNRAVIHTLRHTFASHLAINGTPIFTIQKLMNHSDIKMTMRYAKLAPESGMEAVKNLYR